MANIFSINLDYSVRMPDSRRVGARAKSLLKGARSIATKEDDLLEDC